MNGTTHMLGGALAALAVAPLVPHPMVIPFVVSAALAGPLADIDHPGSTYGRYLPAGVAKIKGAVVPYSWRLRQEHRFLLVGRRVPFAGVMWHRGPTHSFLAMLVTAGLATAATVAVAPGYAGIVGLGVLLGYGSHLALDAINPTGQMLWWPFNHRMVGPPKRWPRVRVGSIGETAIAAVMLGGLLFLWR